MSAPGTAGRRSVMVRLTGIGLLAAGVTLALYVAGRLHTPNVTSSLFGRSGLDAIALKSVLATIALGVAVLQVLLALWIYRKLPLAGNPPRPARLAHRLIGFAPGEALHPDDEKPPSRTRSAATGSVRAAHRDAALRLLAGPLSASTRDAAAPAAAGGGGDAATEPGRIGPVEPAGGDGRA